MRLLVLLCAALMPALSWYAQGAFGPDIGTVAGQYPTLLVAAGYAFAIWGVIFLGDVAFAVWQLRRRHREQRLLASVRPLAAMGFLLTALWMPVFLLEVHWLALLILWAALACVGWCAVALSRDSSPLPHQRWWAWLPLSLHAGWLSLAAFLNTAQVAVAYRLLPVEGMLPFSLLLFAAAAAMLLTLNARMRGNLPYVLAALWGLIAVYVAQARSSLPGASTAAWVALSIGLALAVQQVWLGMRGPRVRGRATLHA